MADSTGKTSHFSRYLKKLRTESGLSQEELASLIGTSNSTICRYESGRQVPSKYYRAKLADVFGVPGYSLFDEDSIPGAYLPDVKIETQDRIRHAMLTGDYNYIDDTVYRIHTLDSRDAYDSDITQIEAYLKNWSFFHQGALKDHILDRLIECIRITRPKFSLEIVQVDGQPDTPLNYIELNILNAIGVMCIRSGDGNTAMRLFGILLKECEKGMLPTEKRFFQKCILSINLATALRKSGLADKARALLHLYCKDAYMYGTPFLCMHLLIGMYLCRKNSRTMEAEKRHATLYHQIFSDNFGLKKRLISLEHENESGIMIL